MQSDDMEHEVLHAVGPQMKGSQVFVDRGAQFPFPSHPAAMVATPIVQLASRQFVDEPGSTQLALVPLHVPMHAPVPMHCGCPVRGVPETTVQVPGLTVALDTLQNWHDIWQGESQQTVSTQLLVRHSRWLAQV